MNKPRELTEAEITALKAEMKRAGTKMREKLEGMKKAADASIAAPADITLPLSLPIWVSKAPYPEKNSSGDV